MALNTVSSDRLSTNVKNTNFTAAEKQDLTNDILPLSGQIGNRNKIINGEFRINQRNHTGSAGHNAYTLDRWKYARSANTEFSQDQSTVTPDGFANSVKMTSIGSNGSTGASDYAYWRYFIEGQDLQDLSKGTSAAKAFTLSFYFKSDITGTFAISILDQNSRMCNANYTVSDTNWNRYTITIPADTTGTIANSNAAGLEINFWLVAGSNYTSGSAVHTWGAYSASSLATGFNAHVTTNGVNFYLTGVQLEVSDFATSFEHRSFSQEFTLCERYYYRTANDGSTTNLLNMAIESSTKAAGGQPHPTRMRAIPTIAFGSGTRLFSPATGTITFSLEQNRCGSSTLACAVTISGATAGQAASLFQNAADAYLELNAEL